MRFKQFLEAIAGAAMPYDPRSMAAGMGLPSPELHYNPANMGMFQMDQNQRNMGKQVRVDAAKAGYRLVDTLLRLQQNLLTADQMDIFRETRQTLNVDANKKIISGVVIIEAKRGATGHGGTSGTQFKEYTELKNEGIITEQGQFCSIDLNLLKNYIIKNASEIEGGRMWAMKFDNLLSQIANSAVQSTNGYAMAASATGAVR
jgi:hypothetical protein